MSLRALHWRSCLPTCVPPIEDTPLSISSEDIDGVELSAHQTAENSTFFLTLIAGTFYCQSHDGSLHSQQLLNTATTHALFSDFQLKRISFIFCCFSLSATRVQFFFHAARWPNHSTSSQYLLSPHSILCLAVSVLPKCRSHITTLLKHLLKDTFFPNRHSVPSMVLSQVPRMHLYPYLPLHKLL